MKKGFRDSPFSSLPNYISYFYQIRLIPEYCQRIMEVGIGNRFISHQLENMGKQVITVDYDQDLSPDVVADVRKIPVKDDHVECVLCYEVLEHLPFDELETALRELKRVTKRYVLLSLPYSGLCFSIPVYMKPPFCRGMIMRIPFPFRRPKKLVKKMDIDHYWTVGEAGASRRMLRKRFRSVGFRIRKEISPPLNSHHIFWVLEK